MKPINLTAKPTNWSAKEDNAAKLLARNNFVLRAGWLIQTLEMMKNNPDSVIRNDFLTLDHDLKALKAAYGYMK